MSKLREIGASFKKIATLHKCENQASILHKSQLYVPF